MVTTDPTIPYTKVPYSTNPENGSGFPVEYTAATVGGVVGLVFVLVVCEMVCGKIYIRSRKARVG